MIFRVNFFETYNVNTMIIKINHSFFYHFSVPPNTSFQMTMRSNKFYRENEMIEIKRV